MNLKDVWAHGVKIIGNASQNLQALFAAATLINVYELPEADVTRALEATGQERINNFITALLQKKCMENYVQSQQHPVFTGGEDEVDFNRILRRTSLPSHTEHSMSGLEVLRIYPGLKQEMIIEAVQEKYPNCPENIVRHCIETLVYQTTIMNTPGQDGYLMLSPDAMRWMHEKILRSQLGQGTSPPHP